MLDQHGYAQPPELRDLAREIARRVRHARGDGIIKVEQHGDSITVSLCIPALLPFIPHGGAGGSITQGQYQEQVYTMIGQNQPGWDFGPRAHYLF